MPSLIQEVEKKFKKDHIPSVRSGDNVRVHQEIHEGGKTRVQVFEGTVIRTKRRNSLSFSITVRRLSGGIGVEKTFLLHAPNIKKVEVTKRTKVRRNYLSYLRERQGKSARLSEIAFDAKAVNETSVKEESTKESRKEEVSEKKSSEAEKQEEENKKSEKPKNSKKAEETAGKENQKSTKSADESDEKDSEDSDE